MHRDENKKENAEEVESARATRTEEDDQKDSIGMPVIPVRLYPADKPEKSVIVYAMLDICSTGTFILQETVDELNQKAEGVTVAVRTVIGSKTSRKNYVKKNTLVVESISTCPNTKPVKLPKCYCEESLPVEHDEIITINGLKKWSYLSRIEKEIQNYREDIPIALILGGNVKKIHEPQDCIPSQDNGPFATRTSLGWCVVGPYRRKQGEGVSCHRIAVQDVSTNEPANHHFALKDPTIKDISITEQLREMYNNDFNEKESEKKGLSVEDRRFLEIMREEGKLSGVHHCLPMPFRNPNPKLPNNRTMVVKRLKSVKNKMCQDKDYRDS